MAKVKKMVFAVLIGVLGLLLALAGLSLISLSQILILYSGLALIILAVLIYFLG